MSELKYIPKISDDLGKVISEFYHAKRDDNKIDGGEKWQIGKAIGKLTWNFLEKGFPEGLISEFQNLTEEQIQAEKLRFKQKFDLPDDVAEKKWENIYGFILATKNLISV